MILVGAASDVIIESKQKKTGRRQLKRNEGQSYYKILKEIIMTNGDLLEY